MRTLVAASVAAFALALPAAPAHAVGTGVGVAVIDVTSFFRPNTGLVAAGTCTFADVALVAGAVGFAVTPAQVSLGIDCWLEDAFGNRLVPVHGAGTSPLVAVAAAAISDLTVNTPVRVCGTVSIESASWGPASRTTCASVLPGSVKG
jgi:hypothetical protein